MVRTNRPTMRIWTHLISRVITLSAECFSLDPAEFELMPSIHLNSGQAFICIPFGGIKTQNCVCFDFTHNRYHSFLKPRQGKFLVLYFQLHATT